MTTTHTSTNEGRMTTTSTTGNGVSFKKLRDDTWGLRGPSSVLVEGATIEVTKRSGSTQWVRVGRVIWTGEGLALARYTHASAPRNAHEHPGETVTQIEARAMRGEVIALTGPGSLSEAIGRERGPTHAARIDAIASAPSVSEGAARAAALPRAPDAVIAPPVASVPSDVANAAVEAGRAVLAGVVLDGSSYRADLPVWEPTIGSLVLQDNGQDLTRTLGFRTVRRDDTQRAIGVVGADYTVETHAAIAKIVDAVTAWCGGRGALGQAEVSLVDDAILWVRVKLPRSVGAMLSVDGKDRDVTLVYATSHDGSRKTACALYVSRIVAGKNVGAFMHGKGATLLKGAHRHTRGITDFLASVAERGEQIPGAIGEHAAALRLMHGRTLTRAQAVKACNVVHGVKESDGADATSRERARDTLRILERANRAWVTGCTALEVFEAVCMWDVACRVTQVRGATDPTNRHATRSLAGDTAEAVAWDLLTADTLAL